MDYYKVMLVDDEEEVREAIKRRLNWEELGFKVVASAENGEEALEKAEKYLPDVVMSDIHMPFMDGLTFCRYLKKQLPGTKFIIFSGYDEFEYAKEAIRLEAEEYILKPIDAEELKGVFSRLKKRLDEEYDRRRNIESLENYYRESLPILKEQLLIGLLEGRINAGAIGHYINEYNFDIKAPFYCVGILEATAISENDRVNPQLLAISLKQIVDEQAGKDVEYRSLNYLGSVIVLGMLKSTKEHQVFTSFIDSLCKLSSKIMGVDVSAGIGRTVGMLKDLSRSFAEAKDALSYRMILEDNQAISIQDVEPGFTNYFALNDDQINNLIREIKIGTKEKLSEVIDSIVRNFVNSSITIYQLQLYFMEIYVEIMRLARSYELSVEQIGNLERDVYSEIKKFTTPEQMKEWLVEISLLLRSYIRKERQDSTRLLVEKAKEYIKERYADSDLSVDTVCSFLGVSSTYFSSIFKKDTGISFVTYITGIRMEQAVHLLESTSEKSYIIAGMVGYEDPNYFSYVFKRVYGISPSKYRSKQENTI